MLVLINVVGANDFGVIEVDEHAKSGRFEVVVNVFDCTGSSYLIVIFRTTFAGRLSLNFHFLVLSAHLDRLFILTDLHDVSTT